MKTNGHYTSERKALYHAFIAGVILGAYGIYHSADLTGVAALVTAVCSPMMVYATNRTWLKTKQGEDNVIHLHKKP